MITWLCFDGTALTRDLNGRAAKVLHALFLGQLNLPPAHAHLPTQQRPVEYQRGSSVLSNLLAFGTIRLDGEMSVAIIEVLEDENPGIGPALSVDSKDSHGVRLFDSGRDGFLEWSLEDRQIAEFGAECFVCHGTEY